LNFTNVKIGKSEGKPRVYDVANWAVSYSYSELNSRNVNTEYDNKKNYRGAITYNYNNTPKNIVPLKNTKIKLLKKPALRLIKDFNFNLMPSQLSFMTDMNRMYSERKMRNLDKPDILIQPTYNKDFTWNRIYDLRYDITRTLKFDFSATNQARIDEPIRNEEYWVNKDSTNYEYWKDSVWTQIQNFGRNTQYHHDFNFSYTVPINKIPLFNWVTASARYGGTYDWNVGPITADTIQLGNTIKNSSSAQLNGQMNLINLYNKIGYLKKINQKYRNRRRGQKKKKETEKVYFPKKGDPPKLVDLEDEKPKIIIHRLETDELDVKITDSEGKEIPGKLKILTDNKIQFTAENDYEDAKVVIVGTREKKESLFSQIMERTFLVLMSVKNISVSYNQSEGTYLPGYMP
jgi:cell surface protein SprA